MTARETKAAVRGPTGRTLHPGARAVVTAMRGGDEVVGVGCPTV
jgi:hypothetical protein